jgi:hypothetical protein
MTMRKSDNGVSSKEHRSLDSGFHPEGSGGRHSLPITGKWKGVFSKHVGNIRTRLNSQDRTFLLKSCA